MIVSRDRILSKIDTFFSKKVIRHGPTPAGVDYNAEASQVQRFAHLWKACGEPKASSILDYGCGYGAMYGYLRRHDFEGAYTGYDVSKAMIAQARKAFPEISEAFTSERSTLHPHDYLIANGIFSIRFGSDEAWFAHVKRTLLDMAEYARLEMALNMLTIHADPWRMRSDLYYADPEVIQKFCESSISKRVRILESFYPYEFIVRVTL